jgi:hypothetical protein
LFEELLDQVLDMLWRRGRVTYGVLKRQFGPDDAYLADLKDALFYANAHVIDDAGQRGRRFVLTGRNMGTSSPVSGSGILAAGLLNSLQ